MIDERARTVLETLKGHSTLHSNILYESELIGQGQVAYVANNYPPTGGSLIERVVKHV